MSDEVLFNIVYYSFLFFFALIGIISTIAARSSIKLDFPEDKLRFIQKKCKKWMVIYFIAMLLFPTTIIPLYIFSPNYILIIQFFILFFTIVFSLLSIGYFQTYLLVRKKIRAAQGMVTQSE
jgi:hypothetical protein